jgi:hypothetical protein
LSEQAVDILPRRVRIELVQPFDNRSPLPLFMAPV